MICYPIVDVSENGEFICTKSNNTSGLVSFGTVAEQMLYEIGYPQAYIHPDVFFDFVQINSPFSETSTIG